MDTEFLAKTLLFDGSSQEEIQGMLDCLEVRKQCFSRGEIIFRAGETTRFMGLVLSGSVNIELDDFWGNKNIFGHVTPGQIFAETYACRPEEPMQVNAVADEETQVLFLDMQRVLHTCPAACPQHNRLIRSLLTAMAQKNLNLSQRMMHTAPKTIRGRLLSYLSAEAARQGSRTVKIPFNRQQLADYLSVDRSALSGELGKMQREGLLEYHKNRFSLITEEA